MPRFKIEGESISVGKNLIALGMPSAFNPSLADFSGIDGGRSLVIDDVVQKAFIEVDEEGTEAAAATAVTVKLLSIGDATLLFRVDKPFLFMIRHKATSTILFLGRVADPSI